jgi:hypothetical protein
MGWGTFWESVSVVELASWSVGIIAVLTLLGRGWPRLRAFVRVIDSLGVLPGFIERTEEFQERTTESLVARDETIADIHREVNFNGGSTLKDAIRRLEIAVQGLADRADAAEVAAELLRVDLESNRKGNDVSEVE